MRYDKTSHSHYCGVDLHARTMFVHVMDSTGATVLEQNLAASPTNFRHAVKPFREQLVVGCECMFAWYWRADLCEDQHIPFVLGHALAMKSIHGGQAKNERIDAEKIAGLLRGGLFPLAHVYPRGKRETRDLLRRRAAFVQHRAQLLAHIQNTNSPYNLPPFEKRLTYKNNRTEAIADRFEDPSVNLRMRGNLNLITSDDEQIASIESHLKKTAKVDDPITYGFLQTIPGIGPILALTMMYEIDTFTRFPEVGNFLSYSRLVACRHESAGKLLGVGGRKMGNAHLKWAFSEAASLMLRTFAPAKSWRHRQENKGCRKKAHAVLEAKIGRVVYAIGTKKVPFDAKRFLAS